MPESYSFKINSSGNASENVAKLKSGVMGLAGEMKGLATAALGLGGMFAGFQFIKDAKVKFDLLEESVTKINAALTSTGGVSGKSITELTDAAKALSGQTLFGRSTLMDAQSMLLTFTQIRGEIFNKTIPAITDFATRFKMELPQAALMVGKALNSPLVGMNRLQRMGVMFSDQQKEQIKNFMAQGQVAKAQGVILKELNVEFGGLANAMTKTDEGKLKMAAKTLDDFKISVGKLVSSLLVGLIPAFNYLVKILKEFKEWITGSSTGAEIFKGVILGISAALVLYSLYMGAVAVATTLATAATWLFSAAAWASGIPELVIAVVALAAGFVLLWDKCEGFRKVVGGVFAGIVKIVKGVIDVFVDFARVASDVFTGQFSEAGIEGKKMIADIKQNFGGMGEAVKEGADKAAKSTFKFDIKALVSGKKEDLVGKGKAGQFGAGAATQSAINTSLLGGASGGLGEAKTIKIDFHSPLMSINVPGGNGQDIINKAPMTMEMLLRVLNNLALSQGTTM
jgi:hypothetical protein